MGSRRRAASRQRQVRASPHDYFTPRITRGAGLPAIERIPYFSEQIVECLAGLEQIVLVGAPPPVTFFAYPDKPSWVTPQGCELLTLAAPEEDDAAALIALAEALGAKAPGNLVKLVRPDLPADGALTADIMGAVMARLMPEDAILGDDFAHRRPGPAEISGAGTCAMTALIPDRRRHRRCQADGSGRGAGLPGRKVIAVSGDGAAMYSLPSLWTMAREQLDVVTIICANRSYNILNIELGRVGAIDPGPKTLAMLNLHDPVPDFVALANGMGVEASRAGTATQFAAQFADAMVRPGPRLIEAVLQP